MEKDKDRAISLISFIPYISSVIVFLGVIRLMTFYNHFGISILTYLEFSEILTSFLDVLSISFCFLFIAFMYNFLSIDLKSADEESVRSSLVKETDIVRIVSGYFRLMAMQLLIVGCFVILSVLLHFFYRPFTDSQIEIIVSFFVFVFAFNIAVVEMERVYIKRQISKQYKQIVSLTSLAFVFVMIVMFVAYHEANRIKLDYANNGTTIEFTNGKVLRSDKSNYFIGKTHQYVFVYHGKTLSTEVISMDYVKSLSFKKRDKRWMY